MVEPQKKVSREAVQAMAQLQGIELTDDRADALVPQVQGLLDSLTKARQAADLTDIPPSLVFHPDQP